ncbi:MAG: hypothetical protein AABY22_00465, partial [Nanoarchaeota archaeon]
KITLDNFLRAEVLEGATKKEPKNGVIKEVNLIAAGDLAFPSDVDRFELTVEVDGEPYTWLANKTSLKEFIKAWTDESDEWLEKEIQLYVLSQNVKGEIKDVVYAKVK